MPHADPSLDDFKARLPLADVVGRWVKLTRRGRELIGLCPFHKEKTPSFNVVESKGFYHCFGCGAHGNAIDFVMAVERLEFPEALQRLEELTGIQAPRRRGPEVPKPDRGLYDANAAAALWFTSQLQSETGQAARDYLAGRGLDRDTIRQFGLGWAPPDRTGLTRALTTQGFATELLIEAGLLIVPEHGGEPFARFRERVMFPIHDARGRCVGFGGRALGDLKPKYLNSPETPLFHKGRLLYNLSRAQEPARTTGRVVVAEGYMDAIALTRAGLPAVAPLGTAVTEEQLQALWRLAPTPTICLDGDEAGKRAAWRVAERAAPLLTPERSLEFVLLPAGEDPDSLLRRQGAEALVAITEKAEPLSRFVWGLLRGQRFANLELPEQRAGLRRTVRTFLAGIADRDVRQSLAEQFNALLDTELQRLALKRPGWRERQNGRRFGGNRGRFGEGSRGPGDNGRHHDGNWQGDRGWSGAGASALASGLAKPEAKREAMLLAPILADPPLLAEIEEELAEISFQDAGLERLRQEVLLLWASTPNLDAAGLTDHLSQCGFAEQVMRVQAVAPSVTMRGGNDQGIVPVDGWRALVVRLSRDSARRRAAATLADRLGDVEVEAALGSLDELLNSRDGDEDIAPESRRSGR